MDIDDAVVLIGEDRPGGWVQYHDGSWAPVWRDGLVGPPFTIAELIRLAGADVAMLGGGGVASVVIDVEPVDVLDTENREDWPPFQKEG
ncbi:hypothetical protein [Nocardia sp. CC227C]|uniref:hypothetical protein n=1 Tax=Nocardia sp. CC227C TaxID=3044562 RepID=UPI00278BD1AF|nr:hypothetical protein [Nocardia sp. CC227C]